MWEACGKSGPPPHASINSKLKGAKGKKTVGLRIAN